MKLYSLGDPYHKLPNTMSGITLAMGGFTVIYAGKPKNIDAATKKELGNTLNRIEGYHTEALNSMELISKIFDIIGTPDLAGALKPAINNQLKEIKKLIDKVKRLYTEISDRTLKENILNIVKEMQGFQPTCEAVAELVAGDVEKLKSYGIYYKIFNERGEVVTKILFADYEKEVNKSLKNYFEEKGFITFTISDKEDIMDTIRKERPDLVYLDIKPPLDKSGFDILKKIKEMDDKIKVLMVEVFNESEIEEKLKKKNLTVDACVKKPYSLGALEALINKISPTGQRVKL